MTDAVVKARKLLRQQAAIAHFGGFALREPDLTKILIEAARACADGMGVPFSQVWQYRAETTDLVVVAGHGWGQKFEGYVATEISVFSFVYDAHPTLAELRGNVIVRDGPAKHSSSSGARE